MRESWYKLPMRPNKSKQLSSASVCRPQCKLHFLVRVIHFIKRYIPCRFVFGKKFLSFKINLKMCSKYSPWNAGFVTMICFLQFIFWKATWNMFGKKLNNVLHQEISSGERWILCWRENVLLEEVFWGESWIFLMKLKCASSRNVSWFGLVWFLCLMT